MQAKRLAPAAFVLAARSLAFAPGRVDFACMGVPSALPFINDNKLLALAVCTQKRAASLPDVATTIELGFPDSDYNYWMGMFVPAKTD
ncbi:MAG: tripartite tricarboxylate transporter substrate-binding protein, partial [Xanthobacteraceae bacterium]